MLLIITNEKTDVFNAVLIMLDYQLKWLESSVKERIPLGVYKKSILKVN